MAPIILLIHGKDEGFLAACSRKMLIVFAFSQIEKCVHLEYTWQCDVGVEQSSITSKAAFSQPTTRKNNAKSFFQLFQLLCAKCFVENKARFL